ncbi:hypothetical protein [Gimesia sp.]|uniref:hypothetical protein n=1 Tax=Gimesia sp. TaxID=2024833 RepID=UPI003A8D5B33
MLTRQEILLISAALQFWAEEMNPEDTHLLKIYSGHEISDQIWRSDDIQQLRTQLSSASLKYAVTNAGGTELLTTELFSTPEAAEQARPSKTGQIGTLVLPEFTNKV